ncbi:Cna protein B-type domain-containing protein [Streptococcus mutans NCTC 11060]|nr:hypothetical protein SMU77_06737 [Streptococcus mutans NV1996]EMP66527.1 Cna protein B-type domain-containing protein [Streptococcus mutans NCTC 11060]
MKKNELTQIIALLFLSFAFILAVFAVTPKLRRLHRTM